MEELKSNLHLLNLAKMLVKLKDTRYYEHCYINEKEITENTITIVMTAHERSKQVYFTLSTISKYAFKDIQIIIVDDSVNDKIKIEELSKFNIHIELIKIKRENKFWSNPCINYNIGFQYIRGGKIVIQNGEVCYVGDILQYVNENIEDNNYYVFDVKPVRDFQCNEIIYSESELTIDLFNKDLYLPCFSGWYQHTIHRNANYHFLAAVSKNTFDKINEFSYDYSFGSGYDDDDYVLKIIYNNIKIINVQNEIEKLGGIHLYHGYDVNISNKNAYTKPLNIDLFNKKRNYVNQTKSYIELSDYEDFNQIQEKYNELNRY
jgi:hypothetical protein